MYKQLSDAELSNINGGLNPLAVAAVGLYLLKDAFSHTDQIWYGFKKGIGQ